MTDQPEEPASQSSSPWPELAGFLASYLDKPGVRDGLRIWAERLDELRSVDRYRTLTDLLTVQSYALTRANLVLHPGPPGEFNVNLTDAGRGIDTLSVFAHANAATAAATAPDPVVATAPASPALPPAVLMLWLAIFLNVLIFIVLMYWHDLPADLQATFTPVVNYLAGGGFIVLGWSVKKYRDCRKRDGHS